MTISVCDTLSNQTATNSTDITSVIIKKRKWRGELFPLHFGSTSATNLVKKKNIVREHACVLPQGSMD